MALTGDLTQLHLTDIIQLIHTTRKSGTFAVRGSRGESRIIFSNGYIVGATHLNNRIRIGSVLVKMNTVTIEEIRQALDIQKKAGKDRKPLLSTLRHLGKLKDDAALRGLKKLIEITIVELMGWTDGIFTFDSETIAVSPECCYNPAEMEQEMSLDAQVVLMDAVRVFDERERDIHSGKDILSYEEYFADMLPDEETELQGKKFAITADILGLADLEHLEKIIPKPPSTPETFDPEAIHRQKIREILSDFSAADQETFVAFLKRTTSHVSGRESLAQQGNYTKAIILISADELLTHAAMTICKNDGILVFATDQQGEFDRIIEQCSVMKVMTALVFDAPGKPGHRLADDSIVSLRHEVRGRYPQIPIIQLSALQDYLFTLQSFKDGVMAVLPKPERDELRSTSIAEMIAFLETFSAYARGYLFENNVFAAANTLRNLKDNMAGLRNAEDLLELTREMLQSVSQMFERTITFMAGPAGLTGGQSLGIHSDKSIGLALADTINIPLSQYSVFCDVMESGQFFFGDCDDELVKNHLFKEIGPPLRPTILILPVKSRGQVTSLIYADFGKKEASPVNCEVLEILAHHAGLILDNALYRAQILKKSNR